MSQIHPLWRQYAPAANVGRQGQRVARRQTPIPALVDGDHCVFAHGYAALAARLRNDLGARVLAIEHVGSTAVPGLLTKPVIDIDLTVADADREVDYLADLELAGWRLLFRDDFAGDPHRQLSFAEPNANLHVWSPGAIEPQRHLLFVHWLRSHPEDRVAYADVKRSAAEAANYNDYKAGAVYDLYERIFAADPDHAHHAQSRHGRDNACPEGDLNPHPLSGTSTSS